MFLGSLIMLASVAVVKAQDLSDINKYMMLQKFTEVKPLVDKGIANEKLNKKPEIWAIKTNLYTNLAKLTGITPEQVLVNRAEAAAAWATYKTLDPTYTLLKDNSYVVGPVNLYSLYLNEAIAKFNAKDWGTAFTDFKGAADISDILIANKLISMSFDTTSNLYAGASAQNQKKDDNAVMMFTKLADKKIAGPDNEFLYQYLTNSYMDKKDEVNFKKYVELGKSLYPNSKYFTGIEGDYVRQSGDFNKVVAFNQAKIDADPTNYSLAYDMGADIYTYLNPKDTSKTPKGDQSELENKMIAAFKKASELKPTAGMPYAILGTYYTNKAINVNNIEIKAASAAIKNANIGVKADKNGKMPPIPKELIAKRTDLYKLYDADEDTAIVYYEKAATAFEKADKMEPFEKQHYKNAVSYLIDMNDEKQRSTKIPANAAKYAAASKKWSALYSAIK